MVNTHKKVTSINTEFFQSASSGKMNSYTDLILTLDVFLVGVLFSCLWNFLIISLDQ